MNNLWATSFRQQLHNDSNHLENLQDAIDTMGYGWLDGYLDAVFSHQTETKRPAIAELIKTPSGKRKAKTITAAERAAKAERIRLVNLELEQEAKAIAQKPKEKSKTKKQPSKTPSLFSNAVPETIEPSPPTSVSTFTSVPLSPPNRSSANTPNIAPSSPILSAAVPSSSPRRSPTSEPDVVLPKTKYEVILIEDEEQEPPEDDQQEPELSVAEELEGTVGIDQEGSEEEADQEVEEPDHQEIVVLEETGAPELSGVETAADDIEKEDQQFAEHEEQEQEEGEKEEEEEEPLVEEIQKIQEAEDVEELQAVGTRSPQQVKEVEDIVQVEEVLSVDDSEPKDQETKLIEEVYPNHTTDKSAQPFSVDHPAPPSIMPLGSPIESSAAAALSGAEPTPMVPSPKPQEPPTPVVRPIVHSSWLNKVYNGPSASVRLSQAPTSVGNKRESGLPSTTSLGLSRISEIGGVRGVPSQKRKSGEAFGAEADAGSGGTPSPSAFANTSVPRQSKAFKLDDPSLPTLSSLSTFRASMTGPSTLNKLHSPVVPTSDQRTRLQQMMDDMKAREEAAKENARTRWAGGSVASLGLGTAGRMSAVTTAFAGSTARSTLPGLGGFSLTPVGQSIQDPLPPSVIAPESAPLAEQEKEHENEPEVEQEVEEQEVEEQEMEQEMEQERVQERASIAISSPERQPSLASLSPAEASLSPQAQSPPPSRRSSPPLPAPSPKRPSPKVQVATSTFFDDDIVVFDGSTTPTNSPPRPRAVSPTPSAASMSVYAQGSNFAAKVLGKKPKVDIVKSVQLAAEAAKKEQDLKDRKAAINKVHEQTRMRAAAQKAAEEKAREEEEKRKKAMEIADRKARLAEVERKRKEREDKEKEKKSREIKARAADEESKKRKLAAEKATPGPTVKRVASFSTSMALKQSYGTANLPVKTVNGLSSSTKSKPNPSFRHLPSASSSGSAASSSQPQQQSAQPGPSTIRFVNNGMAGGPVRLSDMNKAQPQAQGGQSVLQAQRRALLLAQSQSKLPANEQAGESEAIELPDIASEYSDSEDEDRAQKYASFPVWTTSPSMKAALKEQESFNPDDIFGPMKPLAIEEVFRVKASKFRARSSSANWSKDGITAREEAEYAKKMGFKKLP